MLKPGKPGAPRSPDDVGAAGSRVGVHHAVQGAFFDVPHEHEALTGRARRVSWLKPVTEADARKVTVGEEDRNPLARRLANGHYFDVRDVVGIAIWLPWRQCVPGTRTAADRLGRHLVKRGHPAVADGSAGFSPRGHSQDTRTAGVSRCPPLTKSGRNLSALPLGAGRVEGPGDQVEAL